MPKKTPNNINELLEIASLILYKFTENKETWTEYDTLAQALENVTTTNPELQIKITARTQEFRRRQNQTDPLVQEILTTMPDQLLKDRPNFFYYSVPKTPQDMTPDELVQEIRAAYHAQAAAEINQGSISTKEHVRHRKCQDELASRPNGILIWNEAFGNL
jgi:hypothetical protein